jgi:hypothetical protein
MNQTRPTLSSDTLTVVTFKGRFNCGKYVFFMVFIRGGKTCLLMNKGICDFSSETSFAVGDNGNGYAFDNGVVV